MLVWWIVGGWIGGKGGWIGGGKEVRKGMWVVEMKNVNNTTVLKMGSVEGVDNCFYGRLLWSLPCYQHYSNDLFIEKK
jgi:hypothetical protein